MLEEAYHRSGQRKVKGIKRFTVKELGWSSEHEKAFESIQKSLKDAVWLSHFDQSKPVCIFTDAPEHWSAVVTHCTETDLSKDVQDKNHMPFVVRCKGGSPKFCTCTY